MKAVRQFKMLAAMFAMIVMASGALAQELPKIAVYVNSTMLPSENRTLETSIMSTLHRSGKYKVVDRSQASSNTLAAEHIKQRDGSVNNEQIKKLGTQLGVDFICMPDITKAFGTWSLSVRIINAATAEVVAMGEESFIEMYMDKLKMALDKVLGEMLNVKTTAAQTPGVIGVPGQILMAPKYDGTEIYATEYLAAYGLPIATVSTNDVLTVIEEGKSYYKIRTASGTVGFVVKRFLVSSNTQFVDMNKKSAETNQPVSNNDGGTGTTPQAGETPKQVSEPAQQPKYKQESTTTDVFISTLPPKSRIYIDGKIIGKSALPLFMGVRRDGSTLIQQFPQKSLGAAWFRKQMLQVPVGTYDVLFVKGNKKKTETLTFSLENNPQLLVSLSEEIPPLSIPRDTAIAVVSSVYGGFITEDKAVSAGWTDFTTGERWGTVGLNLLFPGLGSLAIMDDYVGVFGTYLEFGIGAGCIALSDIIKTNGDQTLGDAYFILGVVAIVAGVTINIVRPTFYQKPVSKALTKTINNMNIPVLPDKNVDYGADIVETQKKAAEQTTVRIGGQQQYDYIDFSTGARVGTWFLNTILPIGLGSFAIMQDGAGGVTQLGLMGGGVLFMVVGWEKETETTYRGETITVGSKPTALYWLGLTMAAVGEIHNIVRSATYKKKVTKNWSYLENSRLNLAVLPDKDGNIKGYALYSMEF